MWDESFSLYRPFSDYTTSRLHNAALQVMIDFKNRYLGNIIYTPYASVSSAAATTNFDHANPQIDAPKC